MKRHSVVVQCKTPDSFLVQQVSGMFDLTVEEKCRRQFDVDVPDEKDDWRIGLIVGPSGSGKSSVARHVYGDAVCGVEEWSRSAVIDSFDPQLDVEHITRTLTSVGFSSPPAWIRPYSTLSNGEQFRCDLARALLSDRDVIVFDEFTSVVDRQVAKIGSAAVASTIRKDRVGPKRFVAVSCHYDIAEWLEPDWVLDMSSQTLARRCLRRPRIQLEIRSGSRSGWSRFAPHHYLSPTVPAGCQFFYGFVDNRVCGVAVIASQIGAIKNRRRVSRIVVLPDYQGIGIGSKLLDSVCDLVSSRGDQISIVTSHPGIISHLKSSERWKIVIHKKPKKPKKSWSDRRQTGKTRFFKDSSTRHSISAVFVSPS